MFFKALNSFRFGIIKGVLLLNTLANDQLHLKLQAVSVGVTNYMVFFTVSVQRVLL